MTTLQRIRKEHGPFRDIVTHYSQMGMSQKAIAKELEVSPAFVCRTAKRLKIEAYRPQSELLPEYRGGWEKGRKRDVPNKLTDEEILRAVAKCRTSTEFHRAGGISMFTVRRRFGTWKAAKTLAGRTE